MSEPSQDQQSLNCPPDTADTYSAILLRSALISKHHCIKTVTVGGNKHSLHMDQYVTPSRKSWAEAERRDFYFLFPPPKLCPTEASQKGWEILNDTSGES